MKIKTFRITFPSIQITPGPVFRMIINGKLHIYYKVKAVIMQDLQYTELMVHSERGKEKRDKSWYFTVWGIVFPSKNWTYLISLAKNSVRLFWHTTALMVTSGYCMSCTIMMLWNYTMFFQGWEASLYLLCHQLTSLN